MNLNLFIFGIYPPPIIEMLLPIILAGIVGFFICYFLRFSGIVVLPLLAYFYIQKINNTEFFVGYWSNYMYVVCTTVILSLILVSIGALMNWNRHRNLSKQI